MLQFIIMRNPGLISTYRFLVNGLISAIRKSSFYNMIENYFKEGQDMSHRACDTAIVRSKVALVKRSMVLINWVFNFMEIQREA